MFIQWLLCGGQQVGDVSVLCSSSGYCVVDNRSVIGVFCVHPVVIVLWTTGRCFVFIQWLLCCGQQDGVLCSSSSYCVVDNSLVVLQWSLCGDWSVLCSSSGFCVVGNRSVIGVFCVHPVVFVWWATGR